MLEWRVPVMCCTALMIRMSISFHCPSHHDASTAREAREGGGRGGKKSGGGDGKRKQKGKIIWRKTDDKNAWETLKIDKKDYVNNN